MTQITLLACASALLTGPQFFLQLGAWGWMLSSYAQEDGIEQAIRETFNGERPCQLCQIIQASETREQPLAPNRVDSKQGDFQLVLIEIDAITLPKHAKPRLPRPDHAAMLPVRSGDVPVPPPRST
ncbi:MAG: hypothetical protein GVY36_10130 [Verrucomicrobia bacterium]|nr:hypothetical protein [Verrucomicrobiota bacterium]